MLLRISFMKKGDLRICVYLSIVFIDDDFHQALIQIFVFYYSNIKLYFNLNIRKKNLLRTISEKKNEVNSYVFVVIRRIKLKSIKRKVFINN